MIKAVLFDMDGVLIDAKDWHYDALNHALEPFGVSIDRDAHLSTFDGLPTRKKLAILSQTRGLPSRLHEFINQLKQDCTLEITYARCRPVFNHRYALSRLKQDGMKIAVCSNSVRQSVETMMRLAGLSEYLDLMLSNEDVANAKPDPEIYTTAIEKFGVRPDEVLILEDNEYGIQAARASGAHLLEVGGVDDVTYDAIQNRIDELQAA